MSWQGQMSTVVRHLINDVDPTAYTFTPSRILEEALPVLIEASSFL